MSDRGVDGPAGGRMLRLGSMAATFSDSRSRQPVWRDVRAPPAASWHWASANTFQGASSECDLGALGEISANRVSRPPVHLRREPFASSRFVLCRIFQRL